MGTAVIVAVSITAAAIVVGIPVAVYFFKRRKGPPGGGGDENNKKEENKKIKDKKNIINDDNSSENSSQQNTSINNIDNSALLPDDSVEILEVGNFGNKIEIENNDKISVSSKSCKSHNSSKRSISKSSKSSKSSPFSHNYENEVIYGKNDNKPYTIKKFLGAGSVGLVYSGINNETNEENVAIKIINFNKDTKLSIANNEIQIMIDFAKFQNVVKLIDHGVIEDDFYIIMEKCDKNLSKCKMSEEEIKEMLIQFKQVFKHFNEHNLIHRDIKPENILIKYDKDKKPIYKLCDFSLSKYINWGHSQCGVQGFMCPQMLDYEIYTNKADIYSLGATIYYLLYGRPPKIKEVLNKKFEFLPKDNDLKDLLLRMLKYEEKDRISWDDLINHPFLYRNEINIIEGQ